MARSEVFDPSIYARIPKMTVASAVAVSTALLANVPKSAPADIKASARKLRSSVVALKDIWASRYPQSATPQDPRGSDKRVDNAWGAMHGRIEAASWLPQDQYPIARSAASLLSQVFGDGLTFLTLPYPSEWAESEKRLAQIDAEKLGPEIDKVAGKEYLAELRAAHAEYGKAVKSMLTHEEETPANLLEPLRLVTRRLGAYSRKLLAIVDEDDPETVAMIQTALRPIAAYREMEARRGAAAAPAQPDVPPVSPTDPTPEVP